MDEEERVKLIRRGNEFFNAGDIANALKIFLVTDYKDGIVRIADYFYYDKKDIVSGIKLYKKGGNRKMVDDFAQKAAALLHMYIEEDKRLDEERKKIETAVVQEWKPITLNVEDIMVMKKEQTEKKEDKK